LSGKVSKLFLFNEEIEYGKIPKVVENSAVNIQLLKKYLKHSKDDLAFFKGTAKRS
jgi:hypothetical protein